MSAGMNGPSLDEAQGLSLTLIRHGWKNQHANILSSFGTICISWISRPTVEWKDTDYGVIGDGVRLPDIDYVGAILVYDDRSRRDFSTA